MHMYKKANRKFIMFIRLLLGFVNFSFYYFIKNIHYYNIDFDSSKFTLE